MKSKAFIFSITMLYFVMLFIAFLGLVIYTYETAIYNHKTSVADKTSWKYINGDNNVTLSSGNRWCVIRLVYDANEPNENQSTIVYKEYCENYANQRII